MKKVEMVEEEEMEEESFLSKIGPWAFVIGLVIAGIAAITQQVFWMLGLLGVIVGLMNITDRELSTFLLASLTFLVAANTLSVTLSRLVSFMPLIKMAMVYIDPLMANVSIFIAPGAAIVALKALYRTSKN